MQIFFNTRILPRGSSLFRAASRHGRSSLHIGLGVECKSLIAATCRQTGKPAAHGRRALFRNVKVERKAAVEERQQFASFVSPPLPLAPGEVHVWWLETKQVQSPVLLEKYLRLLPKEERDHIAEGANAEIQKERLLARALVRVVLARYCQGSVPPALLCFECSPFGKPWLVAEQGCTIDGRRLHFNLTHTNELIGVAVARERFVGLDAESSSRLTKANPLKLASRRFSDREFAVLQGFEDKKEQARLFLRLWTLKEAYVKAVGRGISAYPGLKAFTFELLLQSSARSARSSGRKKQVLGRRAAAKTSENGHSFAPAASLSPQTESSIPFYGQQSNGDTQRGTPPNVAAMRLPFWIQFEAAHTDRKDWEAVLMEISGGHTAALVIGGGDTAERSGVNNSLKLRIFNTVPLMAEKEADTDSFRLIGYGRSGEASLL